MDLTAWITDVIETLGWVGVGFLVALESVFPPIPSEAVLPLAGYVAGRGGPSFVGMVVAATVGSVIGSWVLYGVAATLGQHRIHGFVRRYGRYFGVDEQELARAEAWFDRRGSTAVLVGRCVPLIRSIVSLPAGVRRMPAVRFTVLTAIGSGVWNVTLIGAGVAFGEHWERVSDAVGVFQVVVVAVLAVGLAYYAKRVVMRRLDERRSSRG